MAGLIKRKFIGYPFNIAGKQIWKTTKIAVIPLEKSKMAVIIKSRLCDRIFFASFEQRVSECATPLRELWFKGLFCEWEAGLSSF